MKTKYQSILYILLCSILSSLQINAQKWTSVSEQGIRDRQSNLTREIIPKKYKTYTVAISSLKSKLEKSPERFKTDGRNNNDILIPLADGSIAQYRITRSDVFHPDLAARYPMIQSYTGTNVDDPTSILKLSVSHLGITGMIISDIHPTMYIDRYAKELDDTYIVYYKNDFSKHLHDGEGQCTVETIDEHFDDASEQGKYGDCQLRKYRLALACTGEYATFHGGNVPDVLDAYNASLTRINGIYEREFAITMEFIANTDELIFLDSNTDPYTNNSGSTMLGENQATIDDIIGFNNYDIGHVFSTGGGGIASLRSPCTTRKARGVTGLGNPIGDPFWVDYVAHEIGHQFGGNHTQNNNCNRNSDTAMEPGSASTIMGYAGICGPNVQNNSDDYFHAVSISEVANFVVAGNGDCAELITIDNAAPELDPLFGNGLTLPISTPFELIAEATDADNEGITYCWEQMDNQAAEMPPEATNEVGPAFRSLNPTPNPSRFFPAMPSILNGNNENTWEVLPSVSRSMRFNVTVRDNNPLAGCTADDDLSIEFTDQAGPFMVTSQNTSSTWNAGTEETITWSVANTDQAPVSCGEVDVYLSIDGGASFDILLLEGTANDGEETIDVPFQFSNNCRLMVKCASSIFLDVNDTDFSIEAPFSAIIEPSSLLACPDQSVTYQIDYTEFDEDIEVTFDISDLPLGAAASFSDNPVTQDGNFELTISSLQSVTPGEYQMTVSASSPDLTLDQNISLIISPAESPLITTTSPSDAETNVNIFPVLTWEDNPAIVQYEVQISENPSFDNIIDQQITNAPNSSGLSLEVQTVYYWRVRPLSECFDPVWSNTQSFQTAGLSCFSESMEVNIDIPEEEDSELSSSITMSNEGIISLIEVTLAINHTYVGDLIATLTSPTGTSVTLFDRPGVPASNFGCSNDNLSIQFSDFAVNTADDLENTCELGGLAISGQYQPIDLFSNFDGETMNGEWVLTIEDEYDGDSGELIEWSISTCSSEILESAIVINNNNLILENENQLPVSTSELLTENSDPENVFYVLKSVPANGNLQLQNSTTNELENLLIGSVFTQFDIDEGFVHYTVADINQNSDQFIFDVVDDQLRYAANQVFSIEYTFEGLAVTANITKELNCFGDIDGEITADVSGGIAPFTYSIDNENFSDSPVFGNLPAGTYSIIVRDANGVEAESGATILSSPEALVVTLSITGDELLIMGEGGSGDYQYSLDGVEYSSEDSYLLLDGQEYTVFVQDANGCVTSTNSFTHYNISEVSITATSVSCNGFSDGSIDVSEVIGGLAPYTYTLDEETNSIGSFSNLSPGEYMLDIMDSADNTFTQSLTITEPDILELLTTVNQDTIFVEGSGGVAPYTYSLDEDNYVDASFLIGEVGEVYSVYVQDQNGCSSSVQNVEILTSVSNPILDRMSLYPNPANNSIQFGSQTEVIITFTILDITGRVIRTGTSASNRPIEIDDLSEGLYICKVNADGGEKSFRLVVIQ
jgi:subtilisin-like proprotein convertase family protein